MRVKSEQEAATADRERQERERRFDKYDSVVTQSSAFSDSSAELDVCTLIPECESCIRSIHTNTRRMETVARGRRSKTDAESFHAFCGPLRLIIVINAPLGIFTGSQSGASQ